MKRLDLYLLKESLPAFLFGLLLYSSLAIMSVTLPRVQWIVGVPLTQLSGWLLLQFPAAFVQTLPIALLLAVLLAFGRLAASNELLAVQAGGVALRRMTTVFMLMGLFSAGFSLYLNEWVLPGTNARVGSLWWQLSSGGSGLFRLAQKNLPIGDYNLYFSRTDRKTDEMFDVRLEAWQDQTLTVMFAERAQFSGNSLKLFDFQLNVLDLAAIDMFSDDPGEALRALLRADNRASQPEQSLTVTTSESFEEVITRFSGGGFEDTRSIREAYQDANNLSTSLGERRQAAVLFNRKLAEPFANFTLLLVALPLAVLYARSRSVAFGLSLAVTLAWYLLLTLGQLLAQNGVVPVWFGLWAGNIILAALGAYLLLTRTNLR